jgi:hypothetical protein
MGITTIPLTMTSKIMISRNNIINYIILNCHSPGIIMSILGLIPSEAVTDQKLDEPIKEFELVHDKLMHVIIVGEDLSYFAHIHPTIVSDTNDSTFTVSHTFPESGKYKLWVDFKPKGENQTLATFKFNVVGQPVHRPEELVYDAKIPSYLWMANIKLV